MKQNWNHVNVMENKADLRVITLHQIGHIFRKMIRIQGWICKR